jgi:DnaJ-class molecular chaperone
VFVCVCVFVLQDPQKRHVYDTEGEAAVRAWEERVQQVREPKRTKVN